MFKPIIQKIDITKIY